MHYSSKCITTQEEVDFAFTILAEATARDNSIVNLFSDLKEVLIPVTISNDYRWVTFEGEQSKILYTIGIPKEAPKNKTPQEMWVTKPVILKLGKPIEPKAPTMQIQMPKNIDEMLKRILDDGKEKGS